MNLTHSPLVIIALGGSLGALSRFYLSIFFETCALSLGGLFGPAEINGDAALQLGAMGSSNTVDFFGSQLMLNPSIVLFFSAFPLGVLFINMLGSLALGSFLTYMQYAEKRNIPRRNLFVISFLGSFTTFSTFIIDSINGLLPFLLQFTSLLEVVPNFKKIMYSFDAISPLYTDELLSSHLFLFSLGSICLNIILCIMCVWIGHGFIKKFYSVGSG